MSLEILMVTQEPEVYPNTYSHSWPTQLFYFSKWLPQILDCRSPSKDDCKSSSKPLFFSGHFLLQQHLQFPILYRLKSYRVFSECQIGSNSSPRWSWEAGLLRRLPSVFSGWKAWSSDADYPGSFLPFKINTLIFVENQLTVVKLHDVGLKCLEI